MQTLSRCAGWMVLALALAAPAAAQQQAPATPPPAAEDQIKVQQ